MDSDSPLRLGRDKEETCQLVSSEATDSALSSCCQPLPWVLVPGLGKWKPLILRLGPNQSQNGPLLEPGLCLESGDEPFIKPSWFCLPFYRLQKPVSHSVFHLLKVAMWPAECELILEVIMCQPLLIYWYFSEWWCQDFTVCLTDYQKYFHVNPLGNSITVSVLIIIIMTNIYWVRCTSDCFTCFTYLDSFNSHTILCCPN